MMMRDAEGDMLFHRGDIPRQPILLQLPRFWRIQVCSSYVNHPLLSVDPFHGSIALNTFFEPMRPITVKEH
jgi:hypothetical protein